MPLLAGILTVGFLVSRRLRAFPVHFFAVALGLAPTVHALFWSFSPEQAVLIQFDSSLGISDSIVVTCRNYVDKGQQPQSSTYRSFQCGTATPCGNSVEAELTYSMSPWLNLEGEEDYANAIAQALETESC